jgi:hypothetical protein
MDDDQSPTSPFQAGQHDEEFSDDTTTGQKSGSAPRPPSPLPELLPDSLRRLLHAWYKEHGISAVPPCANAYSLRNDPCQRSDGPPAVFMHKDGQEIYTKRYPAGVRDKNSSCTEMQRFSGVDYQALESLTG